MALTRIISEIIQDNTIENRDISGSFTAGISGSWRGELSSSNMTDVGGGVSGSVTSTGSFGRVEAAGVVFADSFESVTGGATIDFNDNVNLTGMLIELAFRVKCCCCIPTHSQSVVKIVRN